MTNQLEGENINKEGNSSLISDEGLEIMNSTQQKSSDCSSTTCARISSSHVESSTFVKERQQEDYDYVEKEIDEELICSICFLPFIDPRSHNSCGNTFCSKCVESVSNCPMCGEKDFKKNCSPCPNMIRNLLDKLEVKCRMCKNNVLRGELNDHQEKYCPLHEAYKEAEELKKKLQTDYQNNLQVLTHEFNEKSRLLEGKYKYLTECYEKRQKDLESECKEVEVELFLKWKQKKEDLSRCFELKEQELHNRMEEFEKQVNTREKLENSNKPIHLNVRGTSMTVSLGTFIHNEIEPDNLLKKMFTGQHPCYQTSLCTNSFKDEPVFFIDCDPIVFKHILEWLQFQSIGVELSNDMKRSIVNVCKKFELKNMLNELLDDSNNFNMKSFVYQYKFHRKSLNNIIGYDFRDFSYCDFSGMNLNVKFDGCILTGCNFTNCNLTNINFSESIDLSECNFTNCNLTNISFSHCNLSNTNFTKAKFNQIRFIDAKFIKTIGLQNLNLSSIDFTKSIFIDCDVSGTDLNSSIFESSKWTDCNLQNTNLRNSKFRNSNFKYCLFNNKCKFDGTLINNSSFENVIGLNDINVIKVDFSDCKLTNTEISISKIIESNIANSDLLLKNIKSKNKLISKCNFSGCNLSNINFNEFKFENVNFTNTKIEKSKFENAIFEKCKISMHFNNQNELKNCKFISCNFNESIFEQIDFKLIQNNLETNQFNNCTFKNLDLKELKDLSKFKGSKFDSCLFNFEQFTNKHIQKIQFQNMDFQKQDLSVFTLTNIEWSNTSFENATINPQHFAISLSLIIKDSSVSCELYSHTKSKSIPQLLYRGSRDGFTVEEFHSKCDNQGPTLTIIKSAEHNQIFGGFTSQSWQSPQSWGDSKFESDSSAFIFKICKDSTNQNYQFKKFNIKQERKQYAIRLHKVCLAIFGNDICISSDCNLNNKSRSNLGFTYELPKEYEFGSNEARNYLAGSENFKVCEIEVFKINQ